MCIRDRLERERSGLGQVIDTAMVDGAAYIALPMLKWMQSGFLPTDQYGHLDPAKSVLNQAPHWVESYECKADPAKPGLKQYVSVSAIEPQFYKLLLKQLGLNEAELPHQMDQSGWLEMKNVFGSVFLTRTRDEWAEVFEDSDACVAPVLNPHEAAVHPHNRARGTYALTPGSNGELWEPAPAPKLSRTPGHPPRPSPVPGEHTRAVLRASGMHEDQVQKLLDSKVAMSANNLHSKL
eukprot:TRINITY_DN31063_c0_g1_i2.p1 TRINITY_DN31063_c0_g1~~TRINITY_DN31063_c0_g1_i2.p1  ORF type:complete len:237 (+),score=45.08 TRINITY_DN31063_c0_g1_i2:135-845(+)